VLPALAFILCGYALFYSLLARPWYTFARPGERLALLAYPFASRWSRQRARRVLTARRTAYFEDRPKPLVHVPRSGLGPMTGWVGPGEWMLPPPGQKPDPRLCKAHEESVRREKAAAQQPAEWVAAAGRWICTGCGSLASGLLGSPEHQLKLCTGCAGRRFRLASPETVEEARQVLLAAGFTAAETRAHIARLSDMVRSGHRSADEARAALGQDLAALGAQCVTMAEAAESIDAALAGLQGIPPASLGGDE
jgi:hypothetical protein